MEVVMPNVTHVNNAYLLKSEYYADVVRLDPFQQAVPCWFEMTDRPLADKGLTSYRYNGRYGWIMIGARDTSDAISEAKRSTDNVTIDRLQVWNGTCYVNVN
jgi:hypothetical protein